MSQGPAALHCNKMISSFFLLHVSPLNVVADPGFFLCPSDKDLQETGPQPGSHFNQNYNSFAKVFF